MKKRLAAVAAAATLMFAGLGASVVQAEPGPNGKNDHGICTAYFNGQKRGHEEGNGPGPFGVLEAMGDIQAIYDFCVALEKGIGGNPDQNGRFTDCFTDSNDDPSDDCTDGTDG